MKNLFKLLSILVLSFVSNMAIAQQEVEMADTMRTNGKIYVVVAIMVILLAGILAYLVIIDRKVTRLEKTVSEKK
jgi:K+-transporting ATPase A subunit